MNLIGLIYGIVLTVAVTVSIVFMFGVFSHERKTVQGIQLGLKLALLFYPLPLRVAEVSLGMRWLPASLWTVYLVVLGMWLAWIFLAPRRFGTRSALDNPVFKENPILCWFLASALLLLVAPAIVLVVKGVR